jgi:nicotinamide mononucleotide (NMN) deamidase PncC
MSATAAKMVPVLIIDLVGSIAITDHVGPEAAEAKPVGHAHFSARNGLAPRASSR